MFTLRIGIKNLKLSMVQDMAVVIENQYFPCINYIKILVENTYVNIFSCQPYQKMSFRNRCVVAGGNGLIHLSVPVVQGRNQKLPFKDVRISYTEAWQKQHWVTITSCYGKSAFFEFYRDGLEQFFLKKETFLFDLDIAILAWLKKVIKFQAEIRVHDEMVDLKEENATNLQNRWLPKNFQQPQLGDFTGAYFQVFASRLGFQPNLSILDLLFNEGPNAGNLLVAGG